MSGGEKERGRGGREGGREGERERERERGGGEGRVSGGERQDVLHVNDGHYKSNINKLFIMNTKQIVAEEIHVHVYLGYDTR